MEQLFRRLYHEIVQEPVNGEPRFLALGTTARARYLTIAYTERNAKIRPITGWDMEPKELEIYVEELYRQETEL